MVKTLDQSITTALKKVIDPELGVSVYDLGLIYKVTIKKSKVYIDMTLTTMGCPLFPVIENDIRGRLLRIEGIDDVIVTLTFEPPWSIEKMSDKARASLGFI